jgi:hypothetical protein
MLPAPARTPVRMALPDGQSGLGSRVPARTVRTGGLADKYCHNLDLFSTAFLVFTGIFFLSCSHILAHNQKPKPMS